MVASNLFLSGGASVPLRPLIPLFVKPTFSIAVRSLVEQTMRQGDLRFDFLSSVRPVEGIRAHQKIQRLRPDGYRAELPVDLTVERADFDLSISGRIDGVYMESHPQMIEEIKTTRRTLTSLEDEPNPVHWAQLKCYGYMWALEHHLEIVALQLTYVHLPGHRTLELQRLVDFAELERVFGELLERYLKWVQHQADWIAVRNATIQVMPFPFENYRPGQRAMAMEVYRTIRDRGQLFVQAATGIGKTMAALFPAVKALQEQLTPKIVYLTARTTGRIAAESALNMLRTRGLRLRSVSLTAKDKICFSPECDCAPEECSFAAGYFDRVDAALEEALTHDDLSRGTIEAIARNHSVCPFELSLELVSLADCVIGDYNYGFAPGVMLQRLFGDSAQRHAVIVDEAHNLVDRSRDMFSARLDKEAFLVLRRRLKNAQPDIYKILGRINAWLATARRQCQNDGGHRVAVELSEALLERLRDFLWASEKWLIRNERSAFRADLITLFFECARFVKVAEIYDSRFATLYETTGKDISVKLYCVNPAHLLREAWQRCLCAILFSATLAPASYYRSILGSDEQAKGINIASPFPRSNLAVFAADAISTLYRRRQDSCGRVSRVITTLIRQRIGNYMIFFPSYAYMEMVYGTFVQGCTDVETIIQTPDMDDNQRVSFLDRFTENVRRTLVGFVVMGGVFGEGIDLKGERLTAAAIVGVGLPGISLERELIREHFETANGCGFEFAYQYPGINRVLQAAGRVIRSDNDRGVVVLIDSRYGQHRYRHLLPVYWKIKRAGKMPDFQRKLADFWRNSA